MLPPPREQLIAKRRASHNNLDFHDAEQYSLKVQ